jgi:hypothetical protein
LGFGIGFRLGLGLGNGFRMGFFIKVRERWQVIVLVIRSWNQLFWAAPFTSLGLFGLCLSLKDYP